MAAREAGKPGHVRRLDQRIGRHLGQQAGDARTMFGKDPLDRGTVENIAQKNVIGWRGGEFFQDGDGVKIEPAELDPEGAAARGLQLRQGAECGIDCVHAAVGQEEVGLGRRGKGPTEVTLHLGDAVAEAKRHLRRAFHAAAETDLFLANSGMNAIYAAFRALSELQAARGRTLWIQLGWLYLDTIAILKKFSAAPADYVFLRDVFDRAAIERVFAEHGPRIAGLLTEVPTNPLIQTPDVPWLAGLARRHGAALILDPSVASPFAVDLLSHGDVATASLTKYTASDGDI